VHFRSRRYEGTSMKTFANMTDALAYGCAALHYWDTTRTDAGRT